MTAPDVCLVSEKPAGRRVDISRTPFIIGSAKTADLYLEYEHISAAHACISRQGHELYLWDLNSLNGTFILRDSKGEPEPRIEPVPRISGADELARLDHASATKIKPGDHVAFASEIWSVVERPDPQSGAKSDVVAPGDAPARAGDSCSLPGSNEPWIGLELIHGPDKGRLVFPRKCPVVVGRSASRADLVYEDCAGLSRAHAVLGQDQKRRPYVEDLKSRNGTFVNDKPVRNRVFLRAGDKVRFGKDLVFLIHMHKPSRWRFWACIVVASIGIGLLFWQSARPSSPETGGVVPETVDPVVPGAWDNLLAHYSAKWPPACIDVLRSLDTVEVHQPDVEIMGQFFQELDELHHLADVVAYVEASMALKDRARNMPDSEVRLGPALVQLVNSMDEDRVRQELEKGDAGLNRLIEAKNAQRSFFSFDLMGLDLLNVLDRVDDMEQYARREHVTRSDVQYWLRTGQAIQGQLDEQNSLHAVLNKLLIRMEERQVENLLHSIDKTECPEDKMGLLRLLESHRTGSTPVAQSINRLEPRLKPILKDAVLGADSRRKQELFRLTSKDDWTREYYERLRP